MITPGTLVEFAQGKSLVAALCLRQDKPGRVFVRTEENREEKLQESKVLFATAGFMPEGSAPEAIAEALRLVSREREDQASRIPLGELWELLREEDVAAWSLQDLAEVYFGAGLGTAELSALYRALEGDAVYFSRKGEQYVLRTPAQVEETLARLQAEANREREREVLARWVSSLWQRPVPGTAEPPAGFEEAARRFLTWLRDVALHGPEARRHREVQTVLKEAGISRKDAPLRLLIKAGIWDEHENLLLHKFRVTPEFSQPLLEEARRLAADDSPVRDPSREDLRSVECFTVDDALTTEIDDALSYEDLGDGLVRVGVHIADAAAYVARGTDLDDEARARATAIYLPDLKVRMIPPALAEDACSLVAGQDRPAFSFLGEFDSNDVMVSARLACTVIRVAERHTYESADDELAMGRWGRLLALARVLRDRRRAEGAITVPFPRVNVRVDGEGHVTIEREAANAPSQVLVSEMMILANRFAGEFLVAHGAAGIFRAQEAPEKPIQDVEEFEPARAYVTRRSMRKGSLASSPARHHGLALDYYTQITSPIRRYHDLVMQRQLKAVLRGEPPPYSQADLDAVLAATRQPLEQADQLEKDRKSYWILRFLEERLWQEMPAVVVANHPDKHVVQIEECLWETECPHVPGRPLPPGTRLQVKIELVWPRDSVVRVTPVLNEEG